MRGRRLLLTGGFLISTLTRGASERVTPFSLQVHEDILRAALPPATPTAGVDAEALSQIIGSFVQGTGNRGSDQFQADAFRHFDNASSLADICKRAGDAWTFFMTTVGSGAVPTGEPGYRALVSGPAARSAFGGLTHALADFYSHSNWVELAVNANQSPQLAPIFPTCNPGALPAALQSGYFALSLANGLDGCPKPGGVPTPPAPFLYCHLTLNKDEPGRGHGKDLVPGLASVTYHQLAVQLAVAHTTLLYNQVRSSIEALYSPLSYDLDGTCVANLLFQAARVESCLRIGGSWTVTQNDGSADAPPIGQPWSLSHVDWHTVNGTIPSIQCTAHPLQVVVQPEPGMFRGNVRGCISVPAPANCPPEALLPLSLQRVATGTLAGILTVPEVDGSKTDCPVLSSTLHTFQLHR
jgi:hypothetical protein